MPREQPGQAEDRTETELDRDCRAGTLPYVLIVDDDAAERQAIVQRLSAQGLGWLATAEPGIPLDMAPATRPEVAIIVPEMPGGMEVIAELHQADELLPILAYTTGDRSGDASLHAEGVYQVIERGNLDDLMDEVRGALDL